MRVFLFLGSGAKQQEVFMITSMKEIEKYRPWRRNGCFKIYFLSQMNNRMNFFLFVKFYNKPLGKKGIGRLNRYSPVADELPFCLPEF